MQSGIFTADIGTSSLKAAVIADDGTVLCFTRIFFPKQVHAVDWIRAFLCAWRQLTAQYAIIAICISGNGPTLVAVLHMQSGRAYTVHTQKTAGYCLMADEAEAMTGAAQQDILFLWNEPVDMSKMPLDASLFLPRLCGFKRANAAAFARAHYILSSSEYLSYMLTGEAVTVLPEKRFLPAYWTEESCRHFAVDKSLLAPFVPLGATIGTFCGIPVIAGSSDFVAALIGTGTLCPGCACDRAGSSEGINICTNSPCSAESVRVLPSVVSHLWNSAYLLPQSGSTFSALLQKYHFSTNDYNRCMQKIINAPVQQHKKYYESFAEEGRSFIEQLGFSIRTGMNILEDASGYTPVYTLSGGQAHNDLWCQLKADMTGRRFALPACIDAELTGNAAIAMYGLGKAGSIQEAAAQLQKIMRYYEPKATTVSFYSRKFEQYKASLEL